MGKAKKTDAGFVPEIKLLSGANATEDNATSVRIVVHYQLSAIRGVTKNNRFVWFEKWVLERQTIEQISRDSGYSERSLKRYFHDYLLRAPTFKIYPSERVNLLIDGTYFTNNLCLVLYRDNTIKFTQLYRLSHGEVYEEIKEDLENLLKMGVDIESITCDGHRAQLKAIRKVCQHVVLQRCVVHIQSSACA